MNFESHVMDRAQRDNSTETAGQREERLQSLREVF